MSKEVSQVLYDLLNEIENVVQREKENLPQVDVEHTISKFEKFDYEAVITRYIYQEGTEEAPFKHTQESISKSKISNDVKNDKIISEIESTDLYESALSTVEAEMPSDRFTDRPTSDEDRHTERLLDAFVKNSVDKALESENSDITEKNKARFISAVVRMIESPERTYKTNIWIHGLGIECEGYEISDGLEIVKPSKEDLAYEVEIDNLGPNRRLAPTRMPTLQINSNFRAKHFAEVMDEFQSVVSLLRLLTCVGAQSVGYEIEPQSGLAGSHKSWAGSSGEHTKWHGIIEEDDKEQVLDFYENIENLYRNVIAEPSNKNYLSIAYDRYEDAVAYDDTIEESIASTIMSLEALFLKENEKSELSHRLGQRTGLLLGYLDYEPIEVYNRIKKGYSVRSSYVHGIKASEDFSDELGQRTASFTRQSIILYLQLQSEYNKKEIVSKIDNAVMSTNAREKFEEEIHEICDYLPTKREMI